MYSIFYNPYPPYPSYILYSTSRILYVLENSIICLGCDSTDKVLILNMPLIGAVAAAMRKFNFNF